MCVLFEVGWVIYSRGDLSVFSYSLLYTFKLFVGNSNDIYVDTYLNYYQIPTKPAFFVKTYLFSVSELENMVDSL